MYGGGMMGGGYGMGLGGYSNGGMGMGMGMNMGMNTMQQNPQQMSPFVQILYGLLSGLQSVLHLGSTLIDFTYILRVVKNISVDVLKYLLKRLIRLLIYLIKLKWIVDSYSFFKYLGSNYILKNLLLKKLSFLVFIISVLRKFCLILYF